MDDWKKSLVEFRQIYTKYSWRIRNTGLEVWFKKIKWYAHFSGHSVHVVYFDSIEKNKRSKKGELTAILTVVETDTL